MPVQLFTEAERARRHRFPEVMAYEDLVTFFTLTERDWDGMPRSSAPQPPRLCPATVYAALEGLRAG